MRHGTYPRLSPPGARIARWRCRQGHCTFSLLPDCLAARLPGDLAEVEAVVGAVEQAAMASGNTHRRIVSGAGHDAKYLADICPTGMIFVPCKDGISHNEIEDADPAHLAAGADVLLRAILDLANQD